MQPELLSDTQTIAGLLSWGTEEIKFLGEIEARASAESLLGTILNQTRFELYLNTRQKVQGRPAQQFRQAIGRRKLRVPLAYLSGKVSFWQEELEVDSRCLIPRPETEILIESFLTIDFRKDLSYAFLDLGAGSGAIGISLLREYKNSTVTFSDISEQALQVVNQNLQRYQLAGRSEMICSDLFDGLGKRKWNAIVSNPPYLSAADLRSVEPELLHEPLEALAGGPDGYFFYERIAHEAQEHLVPFGFLALEVGRGQAPRVSSLLREEGFRNIRVFKDYLGIERVVIAQAANR